MSGDLFSTALQLGIGGLSVAGIIYVSLQHSQTVRELQDAFLKQLDERADKHERAMHEREVALRSVEAEVRTTLTGQIMQNTTTLADVAKLLARVARHLDGEAH